MKYSLTVSFWAKDDEQATKAIDSALTAINETTNPRPDYVEENGIYAPQAKVENIHIEAPMGVKK